MHLPAESVSLMAVGIWSLSQGISSLHSRIPVTLIVTALSLAESLFV